MKWVTCAILFLGVALALASPAAALCTCGDRDGCVSGACTDKAPGDECGRRRSCKIIVGTGNDATCCCGCSRGVGPAACNYGTVAPIVVPGEAACGSEALDKLATKTQTAVNASLERAEAACWNERNPVRRANAARGKLARLRKKIEKAAEKDRIDDACAANSVALLDAVDASIDDVEAGHLPGNASTTTTLPTPSCSATFTPFSDPAEVDFQLGCFAAGTSYDGFQLTLSGGRQVTNFLEPPGFDCAIVSEVAANDSLACVGDFNVDVAVMGGRIRTLPEPAAGMEGSLFVLVDDWRYGPYPTTGP